MRARHAINENKKNTKRTRKLADFIQQLNNDKLYS